eukprot:1161811-Pelagomonas_calceolata.AAC.3
MSVRLGTGKGGLRFAPEELLGEFLKVGSIVQYATLVFEGKKVRNKGTQDEPKTLTDQKRGVEWEKYRANNLLSPPLSNFAVGHWGSMQVEGTDLEELWAWKERHHRLAHTASSPVHNPAQSCRPEQCFKQRKKGSTSGSVGNWQLLSADSLRDAPFSTTFSPFVCSPFQLRSRNLAWLAPELQRKGKDRKGKERKEKGYIAVPAYKGSLAAMGK